MGEEEVAPIVRDRPSAQSAFYAVLGVLVVASAVLVDLNYGTSEERIALSEVVIIWATLLLLYFLFNRPFITRVNTERRVQSWIKRWLYTTNHKEVGILYIVTSLFFALIGGTLAELMRTQLMVPNNNVLQAYDYNQAVSLHGLIMIFWFLSPFAFGFANYIVPLQIKAKDLAFPRLNALSYWTYAFSGFLLIAAFFVPGGNINGGWTLYSPLTAPSFMPGPGPTLGFIAFMLIVGSITISSVNFVVTIIAERGPGVTISKMPVFTWFIIFTIIQMLFAFPALLGALFMLISDRVAGTLFFTSPAGGAMLWDNLFWFFGHPEVYIVLMPALGAIGEVLPVFARRKLFARNAILMATFALVVPLSFLVWAHHMFMTTLPELEKEVFSVTTIGISLPFDIIVVAFLITLSRARIRLKTPMLFALGAIVVFIIGGISGVFLASIPLDELYRGSYFVVAHFHYVMVGASVFGLFAGFYYWFPRMTGRMYNEALGKIHFIISFIGFNIAYFPMFFLYDMPRRIFTYDVPSWAMPNYIATIGAYIFGGIQVLFVANLVLSIMRGTPAPTNPWGAVTAEWEPEPLAEGEGGGISVPVAFSPALGLGLGQGSIEGASLSQTASVRQVERLETGVTSVVEPNTVVRHHVSTRPFTLSLGLAVGLFGVALLDFHYLGLPFIAIGSAISVASLIGWGWDDLYGVFRVPESPDVEKWPVTQLSRLKLGIWSLLFSDVLLFGAILTSDAYMRINTPNWPAPGTLHPILLGTVSTVILLSSSPAAFMALDAIRKGSLKRMVVWLSVALALGTIFDGMEFYEWSLLFASHLGPSSGAALTTYFFTIGVHAMHVLAGLLIMVYLITKALKGGYNKEHHEAIEIFGIYWSFVDAIWVFIFAFFFLL